MIRPLNSLLVIALAAASIGPAGAEPRRPAAPAAVTLASTAPEAGQPAAKLTLKPEVTLSTDLVRFGDLFSGLAGDLAGQAAFRAPALGETGTIQVGRIVDAAVNAGVLRDAGELRGQGFAQVVVTRAARRLTAADLEDAIKAGLQERYGFDARPYALSIDGGAPAIVVEPELTSEMAVQELSYDQRSRRIQARLAVPGSAAMRLKPVRITGQLVETVDVVVPRRSIARGETLAMADILVERRPRDGLPGELLADARAAIDKVARRTLTPGMPLRAGDVQREEIVAKGDLVTIIYEAPGLLITMRGKANDAGAMGDVISIANLQSKRVLQGTVSGPGRVSVQVSAAGRVARAP